MSCGSLDRREVWGRMDTCICMAESLHCSPEMITALLTCYTPTQNQKFFFFLNRSLENLKDDHNNLKMLNFYHKVPAGFPLSASLNSELVFVQLCGDKN